MAGLQKGNIVEHNISNTELQLKSLQLTELQVAEIASRHGTINDFGKTFFTDSELYEFVHEFLFINSQKALNVVVAAPQRIDVHGGETNG
jgi:hypothetical protein